MMNRIGQMSFSHGSGRVDGFLRALNRFMPQCFHLRHRQVLTRQGTVRLRFVVFPGGFVAALLLSVALGSSAGTASPQAGEVVVAASAPVILGNPPEAGESPAPVVLADAGDEGAGMAQALLDRLNISQRRLKRSQEEAAIAERLAMLDPAAGTGNDRLEDAPAAAENPPEQDVAAAPATPQEKTIKIGSGDTLTGVLSKAGLSSTESYAVVEAVKKHVNLRNLKPGQVLNIKFDPARDPAHQSGYQFASMNMAVDQLRTLSVARDESGEGFRTDMHEREVHKQHYVRDAEIEVSVFGSAAKAGIPQAVVSEAIRIYSWHVDFQRDIRQGDRLQVMYEQYETEDGIKVKTGNVVYAKLTVAGVDIPIYRYEMGDGRVDYFLESGKSIRKTLMKTPIDGARMSSGYGMRRHPIQGYNKMHKGIDFAAPTGTPIYAAGDGVVEMAGRKGGYGNYLRIRHNSQLKTAYAHLSRFAKGMSSGKRVRQGEVIGYVGSTGASTGPHLHYEVLVNGAHVNPRGLNLPTGEILEAQQLRLFQAHVREIDRLRSNGREIRTASATAR